MFTTNELNELTARYKKYIEDERLKFSDDKLRTDFLALLDDPTLSGRATKWKAILENASYADDLPKLANPFFIGYGSPDDRLPILFLGKEKAFNPTEKVDLFFKESINNIFQWERLSDETEKEKLSFNPRSPRSGYPDLKKNHTWAKYAFLLRYILNDDSISFEHLEEDKSFFSNCFLTEISYIPSKEGKTLAKVRKDPFFEKREKFLKHKVLPKFRVVIIGASNYFSKNNDTKLKAELTSLFGDIEECKTCYYEDRKILPFFHFKTKTGDRDIYLTRQLSGAAGWSNDGLKAFAKRIKANLSE